MVYTARSSAARFSAAVDARALFVSDGGQLGATMIGQSSRTVLPSRGRSLRQDGGHLYWIEDAGALGHKVLRASKDLRRVEVVVDIPEGATLEACCFAYAVGPSEVFWTPDERGAVYAVGKTGGAPALVAQGGGYDDDDFEPSLMAADESGVYWCPANPATASRTTTRCRSCGRAGRRFREPSILCPSAQRDSAWRSPSREVSGTLSATEPA